MSSVITYPIPAYQNLPIEPQNYAPNFFFISNIALGVTTTITSLENMNFVVGQLVRLVIPPKWGAFQLNGQTGYVTSIPNASQVTLSIFSNGVDAFNPNSTSTTKPQIIPVGDVNMGAINPNGRYNTGTFIPGSFINISPNP